MINLGASPSMNLNPHKLRHIFVGERRSTRAVAGPAEESAALMMGHNVRQWDLYEGKWWDRKVEECVGDMQVWRQELLKQVGERAAGEATPVPDQAGPSEAAVNVSGIDESEEDEWQIGLGSTDDSD